MKKTRFTESQIVKALKEAEGGRSVSEISRELGINNQTFYNWKKKYSGMNGEQLKRLKELEDGLFPFRLQCDPCDQPDHRLARKAHSYTM